MSTFRSDAHRWGNRALLALLLLQGVSGTAGGLALLADPSGSAIGLSLEPLRDSFFPDYALPGLVLLGVLGVGSIVAAYAIWTQRRWGWAASLFVGISLVVWIGVEIVVVGFHMSPPLQPFYGFVGIAIAVLAFVADPAM